MKKEVGSISHGVETAFKDVKSDIGSVITEVENIGKIVYYGGIVFAVLFAYKTLK